MMVSILLLTYVLRVAGLTAESLWIDEGYSVALSSHNLQDIVLGTIADQHPPLYYFLLHFWLLVGRSVFDLRYLSVVIGVLGVAIGAMAGQALLGRKAAVLAALLLAFSPMQIWYSQEARMYILLTLLTTLSSYMTWRLTCGRKGWVTYGLSTLLALYTHYFAGFVLLFQNLFALTWGVKQWSRRFLVRWLAVQVILGVAFAPWLPVAVYQSRVHRMDWIGPATENSVRDTLIWMALGDSRVQQGEILPLIGVWAVILAVLWGLWRAHQRGLLKPYTFLLSWFVVPLGVVTVVSQHYPLFQPKQFLILLPPLLLLIADALLELPRWPRWILVGIFVISLGISLNELYTLDTKHEWRKAAAYIEANYQPGDILYLNPAAGMLTLQVYFHQPLTYDGYPPGYDVIKGGWAGVHVTRLIAEQVMGTLVKYRRVWLIEFGPGFWDPQGYIVAELEGHGQLVTDQSFLGVRVRLYSLIRADH